MQFRICSAGPKQLGKRLHHCPSSLAEEPALSMQVLHLPVVAGPVPCIQTRGDSAEEEGDRGSTRGFFTKERKTNGHT